MDSTYPSPAKVFHQLGQCISLELVTGDCSEETWVLLLIRQACTSGKVAHLKAFSIVIIQSYRQKTLKRKSVAYIKQSFPEMKKCLLEEC